MRNKYANPKYALGLAEQASSVHPWGKAALEKSTAVGLVNHAEGEGYSDKYIFKKLNAIANLTHKQKAREGADIALERAHRKHEFKMYA